MADRGDAGTCTVVVIEPDGRGRVERVTPGMRTWHELVGDPFEGMTFAGPVGAYIHGEGQLRGLPHNPIAEGLMRAIALRDGLDWPPGQTVAGPAVFFGQSDSSEREVDIPADFVEEVRALGVTVDGT